MSTPRDHQRAIRVRIMAAIAGALILIALAGQFIGQPAQPRSDLTGRPVLPGFAEVRAAASAIRVTLADETYSLAATPDGWRLTSADGYPIRPDRLTELAEGLGSLVWDAPRTRDPEKFNAIGLGDPREGGTGALVEVLGPDGEVAAALITGRKDEHIYARRPGDAQAFRVKGSLPPLYSAEAWLDLDILQLSEDAVSAVRLIDRTGASLYLRRNVGAGNGAFRPAPPYEAYELVSRLAPAGPGLALTRLQPVGVKPAAALTTQPAARHITETHDGLEIDVRGYREADGYYLTLRAVEAGEGANRAGAINQRASGWAFRITEIDWSDFAPLVSSIARPPAGGAED
ncbi:MAG: DUF4340 domain-containing protein [Hyphomonas sp.]